LLLFTLSSVFLPEQLHPSVPLLFKLKYNFCIIEEDAPPIVLLPIPHHVSLLLWLRAHLKAQATAIEATFMHGWVFADKTLAESAFILEKEVAMAIVMQHTLSQVEQGAQLAERIAVRLHLPGIVRHSEEDAATISGDVAPLVDDVQKAATHNLETA